MNPKKVVLRAAEVFAAGAIPHGADWEWVRRAVMRQVVNLVSLGRGLRMPWPLPPGPDVPDEVADRAGGVLAGLDTTGWEMPDVASLYEVLLEHDLVDGRAVKSPDPDRRAVGTWYTPPELAAAMCAVALGVGLRQVEELNPGLVGEPGAVLLVEAFDPACGAGVFLVEGARWLAAEYVRRGGDPGRALVAVIASCCSGVDVDPVAVDLAKSALWWEVGGVVGVSWLDGRVVVGDTLSGVEHRSGVVLHRGVL